MFKIKSCVQIIGMYGKQCIKDVLDLFDVKGAISIKKFGTQLLVKYLGVYVLTYQGRKLGQGC
jgi:hypothetical protein